MTDIKNGDHNAAKKLKNHFLKTLQNSPSVEAALENAGMDFHRLFAFIEKDKSFENKFDQIVNQKLELALIDAALKTKAPAVLSFALTNRLADKYNKSKNSPSAASESPARIIFTETEINASDD